MQRLILSIKESYNELVNKVSWPNWASLQSSTILVLIASLIIAFIVFVMDSISRQIVDTIYGI